MIGQRLKLARAASGLSLRDLEAKIGNLVTAQAIGKYERNEAMPGSRVLIALSDALDVSVDYLLADQGLVLEVAFEGLQRSPRHKSGVAMRFPRINRLRWDKPPREADRLETLERMLKADRTIEAAADGGIDADRRVPHLPSRD